MLELSFVMPVERGLSRHAVRLVIVAACCALALLGCEQSEEEDAPASGGVGGDGGVSGSGAGGLAGHSGVGGSAASGGVIGDGGVEAGGVCSASQPCVADMFCRYTDLRCGTVQSQGYCTPRTEKCETGQSVCACSGKVVSDACAAYKAGLDVDVSDGCSVPADAFRCGYLFCDLASQFCQVHKSDKLGFADTFSCEAFPAGCGSTPSCQCLDSCGTCEAGSDGGFTKVCPL